MPPKIQLPKIHLERWQSLIGYALYGLFVFALLFMLTFPYDAVQKRLQAEAADQGLHLKFGGFGPGWLGLTASNVQVSKKLEGPESGPRTTVLIKSMSFRPSLFPIGVAFRAKVFGGTVSGAVGGLSDLALRLDVDDVNGADQNFKEFSGLDLTGKVRGTLALDVPQTPPTRNAKSREPDLSQAKGSLSLNADQLLIKGGTLPFPEAPLDLPRISVGDLEARMKFDKGLGTIERFHAKGADVDVSAVGTVKLAKRVDYSEANVDIRLKAEPELKSRLGLITIGLEQLPGDRDNPGFKLAKLTGFLGRPNFMPGIPGR
jgi:type II secretion system protein N